MNQVGIQLVEKSYEITRPADTNVYAANDIVSNSTSSPTIITFSDAAAVIGGSGFVNKGRILIDSATALLGTIFRLHLYHTAPTAINDNSPFTLLYANAGNRIGYIDFPALETGGTGSNASSALWIDLPIGFKCPDNSKDLFGLLMVKTAGSAPSSAQKIKIFLGIEQHI